MTFTITSTTTSVILNTPETTLTSVTKNVRNIIFNNGSDTQLDYGKVSDSVTLSGKETDNYYNKMYYLNLIADNQETVSITGLPDINLNKDYHITDISFIHTYELPYTYSWSISLERLYDYV